MNSPEMHLEQRQSTKCRLDGCEVLFTPKTRWQAFCSVKCRNSYHRTLTPEALHKRLTEIEAKLAELTRRVTVLDDPTAR